MRADQHQEGGRHLDPAVHEPDQLLQGSIYPLLAEGPAGKAPKGVNSIPNVTVNLFSFSPQELGKRTIRIDSRALHWTPKDWSKRSK